MLYIFRVIYWRVICWTSILHPKLYPTLDVFYRKITQLWICTIGQKVNFINTLDFSQNQGSLCLLQPLSDIWWILSSLLCSELLDSPPPLPISAITRGLAGSDIVPDEIHCSFLLSSWRKLFQFLGQWQNHCPPHRLSMTPSGAQY